MFCYIPYAQFRNNAVLIYYQPDSPRRRSSDSFSISNFLRLQEDNSEAPEKTAYSGTVTEGARKRIAKAVSLLIQSSPDTRIFNPVTGKHQPFKLNFVTLTVSSQKKLLTAKEAHAQLLEPFLLRLRRRYGMKSYVWKAELQKRGQIHYHLTTNVFIHHTAIRDDWNNLQRKAGLLEEYYSKKGHYNANSTDVHSVVKVKNIEAYLVKYLSKRESEKDATIGKVWDCSINLKKYNYFTEMLDSSISNRLNILVDSGKARRIVKDRFEIVYFQEGKPFDILESGNKERYDKFINAIQN